LDKLGEAAWGKLLVLLEEKWNRTVLERGENGCEYRPPSRVEHCNLLRRYPGGKASSDDRDDFGGVCVDAAIDRHDGNDSDGQALRGSTATAAPTQRGFGRADDRITAAIVHLELDRGEIASDREIINIARIGAREAEYALIGVADGGYGNAGLIVERENELVKHAAEILVFVDNEVWVPGPQEVPDSWMAPHDAERADDHSLEVDRPVRYELALV
jgi:hypothetical protein